MVTTTGFPTSMIPLRGVLGGFKGTPFFVPGETNARQGDVRG